MVSKWDTSMIDLLENHSWHDACVSCRHLDLVARATLDSAVIADALILFPLGVAELQVTDVFDAVEFDPHRHAVRAPVDLGRGRKSQMQRQATVSALAAPRGCIGDHKADDCHALPIWFVAT